MSREPSAPSDAAPVGAAPYTSDAWNLVGRTLGHYRVINHLGRGGMGEVWVAEDLRLERQVALKVLPEGGDLQRDRLERFEREAKVVAALAHPNIVTLHSIEQEDGVRFLTMELVGGERLDQAIPPGGMGLERFLELAVPMADALAAAHGKGIIHRDLKPTNVVLTEDGRPKILDFGLAELERDIQPNDVASTATDTATRLAGITGTVPYMSPEQLQDRPLDGRSDLFSLGTVFFEMLTGSRPFVAETPVGLMVAIVRDEPRQLGELRADLPLELVRILARCLAKDPDERFADAGQLRDELRLLTSGWSSGHVQPPPRRRRVPTWAALLGFVAGALVIFLGVDTWRHNEAPATAATPALRRIVVLPFDNLGAADDDYFATGVAEEIRSRLAAVRGLAVISRASADQYGVTELGTAAIGAELDVDYVLDGTVRWDRSGEVDRVRVTPQLVSVEDDTQIWSDMYDRELADIFGVQSQIASEVVAQLGVALFPGERSLLDAARPTESLPAYQAFLRAQDLVRRSQYDRTTRELALAELQKAVEIDPGFAHAWASMAFHQSLAYHLGHDRTPERRAAATAALERAIALAPDDAEVRFARGYHRYRIERDYDAALTDFRAVTDELPSAASAFEAIAYVLRRQARFAESIDHFERALALDPRSAVLMQELATTVLIIRRYPRADELYRRALAIHPNDANLYRYLALTQWLWHGDLDSSRKLLDSMPATGEGVSAWYRFQQALFEGDYARAAGDARASPEDVIHWTTVAYPKQLLVAQALELDGQTAAARAAYTDALAATDAELRITPGDARLHGARGLALAGLDRGDEAVAAALHGSELLPMGTDAVTAPGRLRDLALVYARLGRTDDALTILDALVSVPSRVSRRYLELDPRLRAVTADPRFEAVVDHVE